MYYETAKFSKKKKVTYAHIWSRSKLAFLPYIWLGSAQYVSDHKCSLPSPPLAALIEKKTGVGLHDCEHQAWVQSRQGIVSRAPHSSQEKSLQSLIDGFSSCVNSYFPGCYRKGTCDLHLILHTAMTMLGLRRGCNCTNNGEKDELHEPKQRFLLWKQHLIQALPKVGSPVSLHRRRRSAR